MKARKQGFGQSAAQVDLLCRLLGHKSPTMLWEHYYKAVTKKRAAQFCEIEPPNRGGNIVEFVA